MKKKLIETGQRVESNVKLATEGKSSNTYLYFARSGFLHDQTCEKDQISTYRWLHTVTFQLDRRQLADYRKMPATEEFRILDTRAAMDL